MVELFLANLYIVSIVLMVITFPTFLIVNRKVGDADNLLIKAIGITFVAAIIPKILVLFLSACNQGYLQYINNLSETITLVSLILCYYVYRMFYEAFKTISLN